MKILIKSSTASTKKPVKASKVPSYTGHYTHKLSNGRRYSVYTMYEGDADNFQCQITEIHPYDEAEYYWIRKESPASATVYRNGKKQGYIELREWDDDAQDEYDDRDENFIADLVHYMCEELYAYNKDIEPRIDHT